MSRIGLLFVALSWVLPGELAAGDAASASKPERPNLILLKTDENETTDLKDREPQRFAALRAQLIQHNAAINAEGPDWWKMLSPNEGNPKTEKPASKKGKK
jgi:hypothetical protein